MGVAELAFASAKCDKDHTNNKSTFMVLLFDLNTLCD
ncbi:hypothetical protein VIS19158_22487 [Vibrio scophthalmi LMG 19158]|uniref:Uncharacterized protein n=1 Tax=Vibrio scophthalmi LMG 19158 TaxID=870967 RepID=F9RVI7_9VIBR|nr:hypothetical protein VIS19158_22487 [Vibrio scophthalmi LMG 19158]